jgi:capsular polysaccharide biosynthesis protein
LSGQETRKPGRGHMSQQPLDLRKSILIIRRLKVFVGLVAALGLLGGAGYAAHKPPAVSSTAVVSFPTSVQSTATQVVIADSYPVLSAASTKVSPPVSAGALRSQVQVKSLTNYLISITATAKTAEEAEATANAVANSYIAYVANKKSPVAHVTAEVFQPAFTAAAPSPLRSILIYGLVGLLAGALVGSVIALAIGRKDRRLRGRDQIANSIGVPVLASVPVGHPSDSADWTRLLENYKPQAVHAWQLHTVLRYLGLTEQSSGQSPPGATDRAMPDGDGLSLGVVSLSSDPGALALGPQLAVFAASQGIRTSLVIGPQQDPSVTATLRKACATPVPSAKLPSLFRSVVSNNEYVDQQEDTALTVVVVVVDGRTPKMPATARTAMTVIGVSAGRATADQLARAAVAAEADGREVSGILVADPDPADMTTGRVPRLTRPPRRRLPNRLKGVVTEIRR